MKINIIRFGLFLLMAATLFSCKSVKKIQKVIPMVDTVVVAPKPTIDSNLLKKALFEKITAQQINFEHFFAKVKLDVVDKNNKNTDATAFIRMLKDSMIWVSVTGALGIEGYRVLVKPDTVIIMNKLDKTVSHRSVSYLQEIIKLPVDFFTLQDLLMGNPVFFTEKIVSITSKGNNLQALSVGSFFKNLVTIDTLENKILRSKLDDVEENRNRTCDIELNDYQLTQGRLFSHNRVISVLEKSKLEIKLDYKQVTFDEPQTFPFNIPKSYSLK